MYFMLSPKMPIADRRQEPPEQSIWWSKLSLAQKFSASSLGKFGYELSFVRNERGSSIAFMTCNNVVATISEDGDINTSPKASIR